LCNPKLQRIEDHAANIFGDVIYIVQAKTSAHTLDRR